MRLIVPVLIFILVFSSVALADFNQSTKSEKVILNPKQVSEATFKIVQSGTFHVSGNVNAMNLTLNVPQEGVLNISVDADSWKFVNDEFSNRVLVLEWKSPIIETRYKAEIIVKNRAHFQNEKPLATAPEYLKENSQIKFTPEIAKAAFPFERTARRAAELATWVNSYVTYDLSVVGQLKPSDWVYENRRGVCVEYANLLSSLLKMSGIPTRYIVGYAYSAVENKLIGHTWVEILADDGSWIPLDPTWNEAGYLDATHIKTANRIDANVTEKVAYTGFGKIDVVWTKNDDDITLLDYRLENVTRISLSADNIAFNEQGVIKGVAEAGSCTIESINVSSCVIETGKQLLNIIEPERASWMCGKTEFYWPFNATYVDRGFSYTCPVSAHDQTGSSAKASIGISGTKQISDVTITGPDTAGINEQFVLTAVTDRPFTFFSPALGRNAEKSWSLKLATGQYMFYLVSGGAMAKKTVNVVDKKEFSLDVAAPQNTTSGSAFLVKVTVENLLDKPKGAVLRLEFDNFSGEAQMTLEPLEKKDAYFNLTAAVAGIRKISASAMADSITSTSASVIVYKLELPLSFVDSIINSIRAVFDGIIKALAGLFGQK